MAKYQLGLIYILRDRFQVYAPVLPNIIEFKFIPEIVRDLDIVDKELFSNLIKAFIVNNKITKCSFVITISDSASIIKDFVVHDANIPENALQSQQALKSNIEGVEMQAQEFLEHIPFEDPYTKSISVNNGCRAYATNKELAECIKEAFEKGDNEILCALPVIIIYPEGSTKLLLDNEFITNVFKKMGSLKEFNLFNKPMQLFNNENLDNEAAPDVADVKKKDKNRLLLLVGVFAFLFIVLIFVYLSQQNPQPVNKSGAQIPSANSISNSANNSFKGVIGISDAPAKEVKIKILFTPDARGYADNLNLRFKENGFDNVTLINSFPDSSQNIISFSSEVNPKIQNFVIKSVKLELKSFTIEKNYTEDILIKLVK